MEKLQALALITSTLKVLDTSTSLSSKTLYPLLKKYADKRGELEEIFPDIYDCMPGIAAPQIYFENATGLEKLNHESAVTVKNELRAFLEFWSTLNSHNTTITPRVKRVFISHGSNEAWRKIQEYIERTLEIPSLELAQEANRGRTIFQKLVDESDNCSYAVIVMTGDDMTTDDQIRARENVIHEIGYFQGKYGPHRVCLLHEQGVNIPSNIHGLVYIPFPKDGVEAALGGLTRELKHI